jgi:predicted Zn-ribbon and HTH transcriptional regulator
MSSQDHDEGDFSFPLPADVDDWLTTEAARRDESRDEVCRRLLTAAHTAATDDDLAVTDPDELSAVRRRLETQREEFTDLLEDVRSRVIQVKRETDGKAPIDHDHPTAATADDLAAVRDDLAALEETVDRGFDNYETILEGLLEDTDELEDRSTLLARAVIELREQRDAIADERRQRAATERLQRVANQLGVRTATCADCGSSVDLALLTAPACPHCKSRFSDVVKRSSIFGSHRLETDEPPALEGHIEDPAGSTTDAVFEAIESEAESEMRNRDNGDGTDMTETDSGATDP